MRSLAIPRTGRSSICANRDCFVVVDGVKVLRSDYFTFTNLWHTRHAPAVRRAELRDDDRPDWVVIRSADQPDRCSIHFPENGPGQADRDTSPSRAISRMRRRSTRRSRLSTTPGDTEYFVTILQPHDRRSTRGRSRCPRFRLGRGRPARKGDRGGAGRRRTRSCLIGVKLDLEMDLARDPSGRAIGMSLVG
jgi:hypothetical protein